MKFETMTIADLCLSPYNVRTNQADANAITGMAASLLKRGLLYPLVVHSMPKRGRARPMFGVLAGGRRLRAFEHLIAEQLLPADHPIEVMVRDGMTEAELVDMSLNENLVRRELRPYEIYAAVHRAHDRGRSFAEIAETNGQTIEVVRQWARLGALEPGIFAALEAGEISQEQARAFAATEDQQLQAWAFEQFRAWPSWQQRGADSPTAIRGLYHFGDAEMRRLLRFVGEDEYRARGGHYELDLFAGDAQERGRVADEGLLRTLAEEKLAARREELRRRAGRDVRFETSYPREGRYHDVPHDLEITVQPVGVTDADRDRAAFLDDEIVELEYALAHAGAPEAVTAAAVELRDAREERARIEAGWSLDVPDGDLFCTLVIEQSGELEVRWWWADRKAMKAAQKAGAAPERPVSAGPVRGAAAAPSWQKPVAGSQALGHTYDNAPNRADAAIKVDQGLTQDGIQAMRSLRRMALRAALVRDVDFLGQLGRDYLIWSLARGQLASARSHQLGIGGLAGLNDLAPPIATQLAGATAAAEAWNEAVEELKAHPSMADADLVAAFHAFQAEPFSWKDQVAAIVAGTVLLRSCNAPGYQVPLHDDLAAQLKLDDAQLHALLEPTEAFVELLPRAQRLAIAEPHVDAATFRGWAKLKAGELVAPVTRALRHARTFVHPLLRFDTPAPAAEPEREVA